MLNKLGRIMEEHSEKFNKELENIQKNPTELRNTITEIKNAQEAINSRFDDTEECISNLEDRLVEITKVEQKEKELKKNKDSLRDFYNIQHTNIHIIGDPEGGEREKRAEILFEELIIENFPNLGKKPDIHFQEAHRVPNNKNANRSIHTKTHCD